MLNNGRSRLGTYGLWLNVLVRSREDLIGDPNRYKMEVAAMVYGEDFQDICHHADIPYEPTYKMFDEMLRQVGITKESFMEETNNG